MSPPGPYDDLPEAMVEGTPERPRHFRLHGLLGRGGHGEVYRATMWRQGGVQSEVAVKILSAEVEPGSDPVRRLEDEGRLLGALDHPVILKVIDLIVLDGRVALVTEFVDGHDLHDAIHGGELPRRGLIETIGAIADALHVAWSMQGPDGGPMRLIHRDIKPQNIRLGIHGQVKLLDFGIAQATQLTRSRTGADDLMGSAPYLPPERLVEPVPTITAKVDVWGLGCVLYEGLSGERLMEGLSLDQMYALGDNLRRFQAFIDNRLAVLPPLPRVRPLLSPMLAISPVDRPSAAEIAEACEELMEAVPGMGLLRWARTREWDVGPVAGPLSSKQLVESTLSYNPRQAPPALDAAHEVPAPVSHVTSVPPVGQVSPAKDAAFSVSMVDPAPLAPAVMTRWDHEVTGDEIPLADVDIAIDDDRQTVEQPPARQTLHPVWFLVGVGVSLLVAVGAVGVAILLIGPLLVEEPTAPGTLPPYPDALEANPAPEPDRITPPPSPAEARTAEPEAVVNEPEPQPESEPEPEPESTGAEPADAVEPEAAPAEVVDAGSEAVEEGAAEEAAGGEPPANEVAARPLPEPGVVPQPKVASPGLLGLDGSEVDVVVPPVAAAPERPSGPASLVVTGAVVELRGEFGSFRAGTPVVSGNYEVWADFGEGFIDTGKRARAVDGGSIEVSCSRERGLCYVRD